ncbi:MAG: proton-conducting transporter membrane subunit [Clostridiales bacterium]|nr:proton-conducting transporter membrane subunit [Clostridiales bacterium]
MQLWQSIPFACIILPLGCAAVTSVMKPRIARAWATGIISVVTVLSAILTVIFMSGAESYTYMMGHYPAPWGNEIRAGILEALTALVFSLVMLLSLLGGMKKLDEHLAAQNQSLYCVILLLMTAALMAQVYTNDIFTAYVFLEIMTLAAGALIAVRKRGRTLVAATKYMIMNLIGSGLFLLGIILLYDISGHLLMENIGDAVQKIAATGEYRQPLIVVVALISVGLCIKSALFPFHTWVPDAYGYSTPTSAAVLSSLVSKGYIFLLIKIMYRVIGLDVIHQTGITNVLFVFALVGMVMGSISAIRQNDIRRMIAFSSVAQIGYIYMGIGLGTDAGMMAAMFHLYSHTLCKSMLFLAAGGLADASGNSKVFRDLRGAGFRSPVAGVAFTIGALSMVGFPFLGGFVAKFNFALAAMETGDVRALLVLLVLAISTSLNTVYFLRTVITLYRKPLETAHYPAEKGQRGVLFNAALVCFAVVNVLLGICSQTIVSAIVTGLTTFG